MKTTSITHEASTPSHEQQIHSSHARRDPEISRLRDAVLANHSNGTIKNRLHHTLQPSLGILGNASLDVNGNKIYVIEHSAGTDASHPAIAQLSQEAFANGSDSVVLINGTDAENEYEMGVLERDGSMSNMCGNGCIGVLAYLEGRYGIQACRLKSRSGKLVRVDTVDGVARVNFGRIEQSPIGNLPNGRQFLEENTPDALLVKLGELRNHPEKLRAEIIENPDSTNQFTHLLGVLELVAKDAAFTELVSQLQLHAYGESAGEPSILVEFPHIDNASLRDTYLQAISMLLRHPQHGHTFAKGVNIMYFDRNHQGEVSIYPSERGVANGIAYDQTDSCGTGTANLGAFLLAGEKSGRVEIHGRTRNVLTVEKTESGETRLLAPKSQTHLLPKNRGVHTFSSESILRLMLARTAQNGIHVDPAHYTESIDHAFLRLPAELRKVRHNLGKGVFSTAWHETEFPIDPYKIHAAVNSALIAKHLGIQLVEIPYLDTNKTDIKGFPDVKIKEGKTLKQLEKTILELSHRLQEAGGRETIKSIRKRLSGIVPGERPDMDVMLLETSDPETIKLLTKAEAIFDHMIATKEANVMNSEFGKYVHTAFDSETVESELELTPRLKKLVYEVAAPRIQEKLHHLYVDFVLRMLAHPIRREAQNGKLQSVILKNIQDSVLTAYLAEAATPEVRELLREFHVTDTRGRVKKPLSSADTVLKSRLANSLLTIQTSDTFGPTFIDTYLAEIAKLKQNRRAAIANVIHESGTVDIEVALDEHDTLHYFVRTPKSSESVPREVALAYLTDAERFHNYQGPVALMLIMLGGTLHVGSERGIR